MGLLSRLFRRKRKTKELAGPTGVRLTREQALAAVLVRNEAVDEEVRGSGDVVISVPIVETRMFRVLAWFMRRASKEPIPTRRKIELDEIGSLIWRSCDGKTTVGELVRQVSRKYKIPRKEAEYSVTLFIRQLAQKHLVALDLGPVLADPRARDADAGRPRGSR